MSHTKVMAFFAKQGLQDRIRVLDRSTATVELAAQAIGCQPSQIAKTLSFITDDGPLLLVAAGHVKVDNRKYRETFGQKATMIRGDQVKAYTGHEPGGVCPFALKDGIPVYLDVSLRQHQTVYPAAGNPQSVIELSLEELERLSAPRKWVDVCKAAD